MGRKKIEIRPLVDERNRNVTFLKRKAGLMKKAWELSVLCGADVNIIIFNAAGKAYEFSSRELDEEIDRYMDYEGMIERRRAPEFAAMALAGEDEEDEEEDEPSTRRGSTSKGTNNANGGINGAPPRSLKGKESFKSRTPRFSEKGKSSKSTKSSSSRSKGGRKRKERSESEKRTFIDSLLSHSSSSSSSEDEEDEHDNQSEIRRRRKEKERRERERERRKQSGGGDLIDDRGYHHSDKNAAALQYAMSMHSHGQSSHHDPRYSQHSHMHSNGRDRYHDEGSNESRHLNQIPVDIPQLPKLPSDGSSYRSTVTSGLGGSNGQLAASYYGLSHQNQNQNQNQYIQNMNSNSNYLPLNAPSEPPCSLLLPSQSFVSPSNVSTSVFNQSNLNTIIPGSGNIQWNENLIAKYAEFQLQQNHQKQQRLLLERQRFQLQQIGVPIDEKSLLDDIFGGNLAQQSHSQHTSSSNQNPNQNHDTYNGGEGGIIIPLEDNEINGNGGGGGDFIWPLSNNREESSGNTNTQNQNSFNNLIQSQNSNSNNREENNIQWGVQDGYIIDRDDLNLPSPISNGNPPPIGNNENNKRKFRKEDNNSSEGLNLGSTGKRIRM